jgi:pyrroloquinoline quinone (PQQ) biosynthesis protein C
MELYVRALDDEIESLIVRLRSHSFLERCRNGDVHLDELKAFLVQQGLYSSQFTRNLCALMSNLPSNAEVKALATNLFEEFGVGEPDSRPHHVIYHEMLERFSLKLERAEPTSGTTTLMNAMFSHCRNANPSYGLGALCLGAEALVPQFYSDIVSGFVQCGVAEKELEFFTLHMACDDGHAETIRDIMAALASASPEQIDAMVSAGRDLVEARRAFFTSIERSSRIGAQCA